MTDAPQPDSPKASGSARPFAHLNAPLHALYREIMTVFRDSKQRFVVHLRPEDVAEALWTARELAGPHVGQEEIAEALGKLEEWGNLRATPDTSRVTTVEDFYRTRYLYQLTREGEAAERALEVYEQEIARRGDCRPWRWRTSGSGCGLSRRCLPIPTRRWRTACCLSCPGG